MTTDNLKPSDFLSLFYRINEPLYFPKGDLGSESYFDLTPDYLPQKYQSKSPRILSKFNDATEGRRIDISNYLQNGLVLLPLDELLAVKRRDRFSIFLPLHQRAAGVLINRLMGIEKYEEMMAYAAFLRDRINPQLFVYGLTTALLHRQDTRNLKLPTYAEIFPGKFINSECLSDAIETANIFDDPSDRDPIEIDRNFTGNDGDPEHRLAYFREDVGINLHHWHWHLVYPFEGPDVIVRKDRRGELFYYMHRQILARYNVERLCNNLNFVKRLLIWEDPIEEAYFPMLDDKVAGKAWPARTANMRLSNVNRPDAQLRFDIEDLKRYKERIFEAIHKRRVISIDGSEIDINNNNGINVLGNMVEATILTPNADYYGNLHNMGHNALAFIHDPEYKYMQTTAVMSETTTAMRDPVFYRWHAFIDDLFLEHKNTLSPYDEKVLNFQGITVNSIELCSYDENMLCNEKNILNTFFTKSDLNLSRGLDFTPRGPVFARVTHLNHNDFAYTIKVNNEIGKEKNGTIRIFICPILGPENFAIDLVVQRNLMIEMDRFVVKLRPGDNTIVRKSTESSVTIPYEQTFRHLNTNRPSDDDYRAFDEFNFCGCGWPQHMLVPRGTAGGYDMMLFVMISDFDEDKVEEFGSSTCKTGVTFCGLRDKKYPDKRPMGFPFDRPINPESNTLEKFVTPNMKTVPIKIIHHEDAINRNSASPVNNAAGTSNSPSNDPNTANAIDMPD